MSETFQASDQARFFRSFSKEVARLAGDIEHLQDVLGDERTGEGIDLRAQCLDELAQRAHALSGVAASLSEDGEITPAVIRQALARVLLGDLASRLAGGAEVTAEERGECELF